MTDLLLLLANNTDAHCPPLTVPTVKDDVLGCAYTNWAYALFAAVALIIVAIPFVAFICYVQRRVKNKHRARVLAHSTSYESSGAYPYQPLHGGGQRRLANYGAIDSGTEEQQALRSPSHASTASLSDRQSHQKDTTSVASSRASIIPTYDDVSLNQRNAAANKAERNGVNQSTGPPRRSSRSSRLSLDSQEKSGDQGGQFYDSVDVVTNIPKLQKQAGPKDMPPAKPPRLQVLYDANSGTPETHVYDDVEQSELEGNKQRNTQPPLNGTSAVDGLSAECEDAEQAATDDIRGNDNNMHTESPEYATLEPLPDASPNDSYPTNNYASKNDQENLLIREQKQCLLSDDKQPTTETEGSPVSQNKYLTVLPPTPPKQNESLDENAGLLQSNEDFDQMSVSPPDKSVPKSRSYFEELLLGKVRNMPANKRNGTFLLRDSVSSAGSKVLTLYCWKPDSNKELYNFKVSLTEDGEIYLHKSSRKFSELSELLEFLRKDKDMLPCVLTTQVFQ